MTLPAPTIKDWPLRTTMPVNSLLAIVEPSSGDTSKFTFAKITAPNAGPQPSSTTPLMNGTAAIGTGTTYALSNHVHPTDTSRAPTASPTFTGTVTAASLTLTTPLPVASGGTAGATAAAARTNLGLAPVAFNVDFSQGAIVVAGTITVVRKAPFAFTINSLDYEVGSAGGSFTVATQINGTPVTGLSAVAVSSATSANAAATALNTVNVGDKVTLVISAVSGSPTGANLQINGTR